MSDQYVDLRCMGRSTSVEGSIIWLYSPIYTFSFQLLVMEQFYLYPAVNRNVPASLLSMYLRNIILPLLENTYITEKVIP